jgi:anti-sigma regulatory factor (Ser/Thr protein kinase)
VVDDGRPFDPRKYPAIEKTDAAIQGVHTGRGIHLIRNLLDRMDYERQDGHNVLILTKNLT